MKIHRFIFDWPNEHEFVITDREIVHQATRVLRLREGDEMILQRQDGIEARVEITDQTDLKLWVKMLEKKENKNELDLDVALYCAILKKENFELVVQKATEIGVKKIVPIITDRTIKTSLRFERLQIIAKEAVEQSGRATMPEIGEIMDFENALKDAEKYDAVFLFDKSGESKRLGNTKSRAIFIGPEGGFTEREIEMAKQNKAQIISLGSLTLRGETAAIIASFLGSGTDF